MRINAITNFKGISNPNFQPQNKTPKQHMPAEKNNFTSHVEHNYGKLLVNKPNITFGANIAKTALELAQQIPLEDRVSSVFKTFQHGDLILVSKSLGEAQEALKKSYKTATQMFKKIIFLPDKKVEGTLAFTKHANGEKELWNVNPDNIFIGRDLLKTTETGYIIDGDTIKYKDFEMPIKESPKTDLGMFKNTFIKVLDFEKDIKPVIEKQNLKTILSLSKELTIRKKPVMFSDVGGQDKAIDMLKKGILYPLKYPQAYKGTMLNHGAVLYGPPGTGKTRLAMALSNEAGVNFMKLNGLEMESKWVGESEENWRTLFQTAKENQPSIIFIDEFDAVAKSRGGHDAYGDKVVNQILTLMSDLEKDGEQVVVITATNRKDTIDSAIMRSGRFSLHVPVELPDKKGLKDILDIHTKNSAVSLDIDKDILANELFKRKATGSDVPALISSAQTNAYERFGIHKKMDNGTFTAEDLEKVKISSEDFDKAIEDLFGKTQSKPIGFVQYG